MLRFIFCLAILTLSCNVCPAEELIRAALSCPPTGGWETNIYSGRSLAKYFNGDKIFGFEPPAQLWKVAFSEYSDPLGLVGYWKAHEDGYFYHTYLAYPPQGGWVESDLLHKSLVYRHKDGKDHSHYQENGMVAVSIYDKDSDVPAPALFYWKINWDGFLLTSPFEDMREAHKMRLVKREGQKLIVEVNGKELTLEYLPKR